MGGIRDVIKKLNDLMSKINDESSNVNDKFNEILSNISALSGMESAVKTDVEYLKLLLGNLLDSCSTSITINKSTAYDQLGMSDYVISGESDCRFRIMVSSSTASNVFNFPIIIAQDLTNTSINTQEFFVLPETGGSTCPSSGWKLVGKYKISPAGTYLVQGEVFSDENADMLVVFESENDVEQTTFIIDKPAAFVWSKGVIAGTKQTVPFSFLIKNLSEIKVLVACNQNTTFYAHAFISGYLIKQSS